MNLITATKSCLSKFAVFNGRASRSEYWYFILAIFLFSFVASFALAIVMGSSASKDQVASASHTLSLIINLVILLPSWSVATRRIHDSGKSGWFILIPIYGFILLFFKSEPQDNKYGPYLE